MLTKLPDELRQVIQQHPNDVRLQDDQTHRRAMRALKEQEDWDSVQRGLANRENGREMPLAEADAQIRKELGFPPRERT